VNIYSYVIDGGQYGVVLASSPASAASRALSLRDVDLKLGGSVSIRVEFSAKAPKCEHGKPYISEPENACIRCRSAANLAKNITPQDQPDEGGEA